MPTETNWQKATLGDIARKDEYGLVDGPFGSNLPASLYIPSGVPVIRGSNLTLGHRRFVDDEFVFVSEETANRLRRSVCRPNDIIFTKKGTLGQTAIIPTDHRYTVFLISSNQMKLSVNPRVADPLFVYYFVSSAASRQKIVRDAEATGVPKTNLRYLRTFPILLPPLAEQRAIAYLLGTLDDKIEMNRRMNETLEAMAQAFFKSWFVPATANGLPEGWRASTIGEEVRVVGGSTPSTTSPEFWEGGSHYWATPKDLSAVTSPVLLDTERKITDAGVEQISSGLLPKGTVLLSSRAPIGYLVVSEVPVSVNQGFIAMVCDKELPNHYIRLWAKQNMETIKANANGTTFLEISKKNFRPLTILVPPNDLIQDFVRQVKPMQQRVVANLRESLTLTALRDALLPKLLSGAIRVKDAAALCRRSDEQH